MDITKLSVEGYRSIKDVWLKLHRVNVIVGANGTGKSNLYRALYLVAQAASGGFARALAQEGGMPSALWAGSRGKNERKRMKIAVTLDGLKYSIICGLVPVSPGDPTQFYLDPDIKEEKIWCVDGSQSIRLLQRKSLTIDAHDANGQRIIYPSGVSASESVLAEIREPHKFPELSTLRQTFLDWRFYHQFRTDMTSPIRSAQIGFRTPVISNDGVDLAAALQTIREVGDVDTLEEMIDMAFPGARVIVDNNNGMFSLSMQMPGFNRAFTAQELSDGTLQYLCLLVALLSPRPAKLIALNEPETSIHPDLLLPLSKLIANASGRTQIWITTHSNELADQLLEHTGAVPIELVKLNGATEIVGHRADGSLSDDDDVD